MYGKANSPASTLAQTLPNLLKSPMTFTGAYLALAGFLALLGLLLLAAPGLLRSLPRSPSAGLVLGLAAVGLLGWHLWNLPEPDLAGFPRLPVTVAFVVAGLAAFVWMPDLIAVRGLGALMLFLARATLDAGWGRLPDSLLLASVSYALLVVPGLLWAASPGQFVRFLDLILPAKGRRLALGVVLLLVALACAVQGLTLPA
jgi:hypothetical protein